MDHIGVTMEDAVEELEHLEQQIRLYGRNIKNALNNVKETNLLMVSIEEKYLIPKS